MTKTRDLANLIADSKIGPTEIDTSGTYTVGGIVTSGNVDGRDVSVDGAKLDGIEASADVTDAANVTAAGALMDSEVTNLTAVKAINQGLATTDSPAFESYNLNAIAKDISNTAVDIVVYDTAKDSDGGAWRHKTQHTSWYNETLNSSTRGARKEFPSVAVIVAEVAKVTIYDGDDPDMPMWMVFNQPTNSNITHLATNAKTISCISMLNGSLCVGFSDGGWGVSQIGFVTDSQRWLWSNNYYMQVRNTVVERNTTGVYVVIDTIGLNDAIIHDIAMTVLPNSLIDPKTGLPAPTLAVTHDKGATVVKDNHNGTITFIDKTTTADAMSQIAWMGQSIVCVAPLYYGIYKDPFSEESSSYLSNTSDANYYWADDATNPYGGGAFNFPRPLGNTDKLVTAEPKTIITSSTLQTVNSFNGQAGLTIHQLSESDITDNADGIAAYITSSYNTGWQVGDTRIATLSDTDTTNAVATNLVTNGTFTSDTTGWTSSGTSISIDSNRLKVVGWGAHQTLTTVVGKWYRFTVDFIQNSSHRGGLYLGTTNNGAEIFTSGAATSSTTIVKYFKATTTSVFVKVGAWDGGSEIAFYDNIACDLLEADHSYHHKGPLVYGTVTKTAVASGAELVGYSGFSSSNYFQQKIFSNIQDMERRCFMCWVKASKQATGYQYIFALTDNTAYHYGLAIFQGTSGDGGKPYIYDQEHGVVKFDADIATDSWRHVVLTDDETRRRLYVDGYFVGEGGGPYDLNSANKQNMVLRIGNFSQGQNPMNNGSLALFKASNTIPSDEQIKQIYAEEKLLFVENAKATLYGSSDTITGLAYDDVKKEFHAGTSAGRSVFKDLNRISNTTDAIGAVISVSNGLVAEE